MFSPISFCIRKRFNVSAFHLFFHHQFSLIYDF